MIRGYYTAASGMVAQEKRLNAIANNIANVNTAGYKKDDIVLGTFGEHIAVRMDTYNQTELHRIGQGAWMQVAESKYVNHNQGSFNYTGRQLDFLIQGDGFFVLNTADGERLTRDGQFAIDAEGFLELPGYGRVLNEDGDEIEIGTSAFEVSGDGTIYLLPTEEEADPLFPAQPEEFGRLMIAIPDELDYSALTKDANGLFISPGYTVWTREEAAEEGELNPNTLVRQYHTENSNVYMGEEMTRMMSTQRSIQAASQLVKMYDEMSDQANSRISRV